MAQSSTAKQMDEPLAELPSKRRQFDGGEPPVRANTPVGANAWLAVWMFIGAEAMFFAGLIGAFLVFRLSAASWPPPFQPRLPTGVTGINTLILLLSAVTMRRSLAFVRAANLIRALRCLGATVILGTLFLAVQGYEWVQLIRFGLTVSSSVYGGLFYTLIGFHGLHVFGALICLLVVFARARKGRYTAQRHVGLQICAMFWTFVVALWPVLYGLVYLY